MQAFAAALSGGSGALPRLESLWLTTTASAIRGCRPLPPLSAAAGRCRSSRAWTSAITSNDGMSALSGALGKGALPALERIVVCDGHEEHPQLVAACQPRDIAINP